MIRSGQYIKPEISSLPIPKKSITGCEILPAVEPVIAKTINIAMYSHRAFTFQRFLSFLKKNKLCRIIIYPIIRDSATRRNSVVVSLIASAKKLRAIR